MSRAPESQGEALTIFERHEAGILNLVRAADLYSNHLMAKLRGKPLEPHIVTALMDRGQVSGLAFFAIPTTPDERAMLEREGHFREIGQQILVATYTAVESYLSNKFAEYYRFRQAGADPRSTTASLEMLQSQLSRSLDDARAVFRKVLDLDIRWFEVDDIETTYACSFVPPSTWDALCLMSRVRNAIVHGGDTGYCFHSLVDAWYPFLLVRSWATLFDANFDMLVYDNRRTKLIEQYAERRRRNNYLPGEYPAKRREGS